MEVPREGWMLDVVDNRGEPEEPRESRDRWSMEGESRLKPGGGLHAYNMSYQW